MSSGGCCAPRWLIPRIPSLAHSPQIRRYPRGGFSRTSRKTSSTTAGSRRVWTRGSRAWVNRRHTNSRCQRKGVAGVTRNTDQRSRGNSLANVATTSDRWVHSGDAGPGGAAPPIGGAGRRSRRSCRLV
jgi:hypothetical protein